MSCDVMSCHVMSCHVMSCHLTSLSSHLFYYLLRSSRVLSCHVLSWCVVSDSSRCRKVRDFLFECGGAFFFSSLAEAAVRVAKQSHHHNSSHVLYEVDMPQHRSYLRTCAYCIVCSGFQATWRLVSCSFDDSDYDGNMFLKKSCSIN